MSNRNSLQYSLFGIKPLALEVNIVDPLPSERIPPSRGGEGGVHAQGMLPIAKSEVFESWVLPGHGESYGDCGRFGWKGCLNVEGHSQPRLDVGTKYAGKVYVRGYRRSCDRAECPVCFEMWASRAGARAERRLKLYKGGYRRAIHVSVSVPEVDWGIPYSNMRRKAYRLLREVGVKGGVMVFHPWRKDARGWCEAAHFHIVGYGWIVGTKEVFERTGWVIHNIGVRKTIGGTISYQLSHAGVNPSYHTLTWFGDLSYAKLRVKAEDPEEVCPLCDEPLVLLRWVGLDRPPPEVEGEYYLDPEGWQHVRGYYLDY